MYISSETSWLRKRSSITKGIQGKSVVDKAVKSLIDRYSLHAFPSYFISHRKNHHVNYIRSANNYSLDPKTLSRIPNKVPLHSKKEHDATSLHSNNPLQLLPFFALQLRRAQLPTFNSCSLSPANSQFAIYLRSLQMYILDTRVASSEASWFLHQRRKLSFHDGPVTYRGTRTASRDCFFMIRPCAGKKTRLMVVVVPANAMEVYLRATWPGHIFTRRLFHKNLFGRLAGMRATPCGEDR